MCLDLIAISDVNPVGLALLAGHPDRVIRTALASSPHAPTSIINQLVLDRDPHVRRYALAQTTNPEALASATAPGKEGLLASSAHSNPAAPVSHLTAALTSKDRAVRLAAWCNPSTPLAERMRLTPPAASSITHVGGSLADQVVRSHALVLNNPWMLENPGRWDGNTRRALAAIFEAPQEALKEILDAGSAGRKAVKAHPAFNNLPGINFAGIETLINVGSPAVDVKTVSNPATDENSVRLLLKREDPQPEPIVIGLAVRRFGVKILTALANTEPKTSSWSSTRYAAASWFSPVLGFVPRGFHGKIADIEAASVVLGESVSGWETFLGLLPSWHGSAQEAAETATRV